MIMGGWSGGVFLRLKSTARPESFFYGNSDHMSVTKTGFILWSSLKKDALRKFLCPRHATPKWIPLQFSVQLCGVNWSGAQLRTFRTTTLHHWTDDDEFYFNHLDAKMAPTVATFTWDQVTTSLLNTTMLLRIIDIFSNVSVLWVILLLISSCSNLFNQFFQTIAIIIINIINSSTHIFSVELFAAYWD